MFIILKIMGMFIICIGFAIFLNPSIIKSMIAFWKRGKRLYLGGLLRIFFGLVFLLSASQTRLPLAMVVLGVFSLISGSLVFILGCIKIKAFLDFWDKKPVSVLRLSSLLTFAIGALIMYATGW